MSRSVLSVTKALPIENMAAPIATLMLSIAISYAIQVGVRGWRPKEGTVDKHTQEQALSENQSKDNVF